MLRIRTQSITRTSLFAKALLKLGTQMKDTVSITGFNSPEYHFALHGTWLAGGVTAGIYTTNSEEATAYVINHSESVVCVCQSGKQLQKLVNIRERCPTLKAIVVYWPEEDMPTFEDKEGVAKVYLWKDFQELGADIAESAVDSRIDAIQATRRASCVPTTAACSTRRTSATTCS